MKTNQQHRTPVITADGNGEERAAQIRHIQERLARLGQAHEQISAEVKELTHDLTMLSQERGAPAPRHAPSVQTRSSAGTGTLRRKG